MSVRYIYYYLSDRGSINSAFQNYQESKIDDQKRYALDAAKKKFQKAFGSSSIMKQINKSSATEEVINLLNELQNDPQYLTKAVENSLNQVKIDSVDFSSLEQVKSDLSNLDDALKTVEEMLKKYITQETGALQAINVSQFFDVNGNLITGKKESSEIRKKIRKSIYGGRGKNNVFKTNDTSYDDAIGLLKAVDSGIKMLKGLSQNNNFGSNSEKSKSIIIKYLVNGIKSSFQRFLGLINEDSVKGSVENYLNQEVFKMFGHEKGMRLTVEKSGNVSGAGKGGYKKKTSDLEIYLDFDGMIKGKPGHFKIKLFGVSVKRTFGKGISHTIKLKTRAKIETLLHNALLIGNKAVHFDEFYHLLAHYEFNNFTQKTERHEKEQRELQARVKLPTLTTILKYAMLPTAIGGSLTKDDFAYFVVINDQVYTIFDLLENTVSENIILSPNLETMTKEIGAYHGSVVAKTPRGRWGRSNKVLKKIRAQSLAISMNLALNRATNLTN